MTKLYLASASPRRKQLLEQLGLTFETCPVDADESVFEGEGGSDYVKRLAKLKATMAADHLQCVKSTGHPSWVIGSDTSVVVDDRILGKPVGWADFETMMRLMSGRKHDVLTGVCVVRFDSKQSKREQKNFVVRTEVTFKDLDACVLDAYWKTGEPLDKAGGYGIQGLGAVLVDHIYGSYSNVVGLPVSELASQLDALGFDFWQAVGQQD